MNIAFFDMDGTITNRDSLIHFINYSHGYPQLVTGILINLPYLIAYKIGLYQTHKAKEKFISHFFGGWGIEQFNDTANKYSAKEINKIIRPQAIEKIRWHQSQGDKVVVVSASIENWLEEWCKTNDMELISTRLKIENSKVTGKFATKNCKGMEKVRRIKEKYDLSQFETIYAYGDSSGDTEMLQLANKKYFKPFR